MIFRNIILASLLLGLLAGALLSAIQHFSVTPIILAAEGYEQVEVVAADHDHASHQHDDEAWAPEDGLERSLYTFFSNVFVGIGFTALLLAAMTQLRLQGLVQLDAWRGSLWGAAGFAAFFLLPGLGLPPEIPGVEAAAIENRQQWWLLMVVSAIAGFVVLALTPMKFKAAGLVLLVLPFIIGAPHLAGLQFSHPDPAAVAALTDLHQQFIWASGVCNLVFWLTLGCCAALLVKRQVAAITENTASNDDANTGPVA